MPRTMSAEREAEIRDCVDEKYDDDLVELLAELAAERAVSKALAGALSKSRCICKQEWEDECPTCGSRLIKVRNDPNGMLNDEQFDSVRAGDFYCQACRGTEARTGYKYWWKRDLKEKREQCVRCAALAQYAALEPPVLASSEGLPTDAAPSQGGRD